MSVNERKICLEVYPLFIDSDIRQMRPSRGIFFRTFGKNLLTKKKVLKIKNYKEKKHA